MFCPADSVTSGTCAAIDVRERPFSTSRALRGTVPSYFIKQIAQEITRSTAGVKALTYRLTVRVPSADPGD